MLRPSGSQGLGSQTGFWLLGFQNQDLTPINPQAPFAAAVDPEPLEPKPYITLSHGTLRLARGFMRASKTPLSESRVKHLDQITMVWFLVGAI